MDTVEEITKENYTIKIYWDELVESPREWDNLGTMVCWHNRYTLGDEHNYKTWQEWLVTMVESVINPYQDKINGWYIDELGSYAIYNNIPNPDTENNYILDKLNAIFDKHFICLPLYLYDHSGITMNTTGFYCPWDSGQVGYIYVSKDQVKSEWGWKRITKKREKFIADILRGEIEIYDQYLTGDVYFFNVECNKCGETLDSCGGFYGDNWKENGLLEYAEGNHICQDCDISGLLH